MNDNITLPRDDDDEEFTRQDVTTLLLEVMDWTYAQAHRNRPMTEAEQKVLDDIRTALAAPKQEPVAWMDRFGFVFRGKGPHETFTTPLYTAPSALAAEQPRHPGYIIGSHWFEIAYERLCAGEAEDAILEDYELVREPRLRDLRRDAERYRWLRDNAAGFSGKTLDAAIDAEMEASTAPASAAADSSTAPEAKP